MSFAIVLLLICVFKKILKEIEFVRFLFIVLPMVLLDVFAIVCWSCKLEDPVPSRIATLDHCVISELVAAGGAGPTHLCVCVLFKCISSISWSTTVSVHSRSECRSSASEWLVDG